METILTLAAAALLLAFKMLLITAFYVLAALLIPVAWVIYSIIHIARNTK